MKFWPETWREVFWEVKKTFPGAIIAGGALRDWYLGKEVKDVDIFVPWHPVQGPMLDGWKPMSVEFLEEEGYGLQRAVQGVWEKEVEGIKFQIIKVSFLGPNFVYDLMHNFDIGLCKVWGRTEGVFEAEEVYFHPDFVKDAYNRTLTVTNFETPQSTVKRMKRLSAKYPDFKVVWDEPVVKEALNYDFPL